MLFSEKFRKTKEVRDHKEALSRRIFRCRIRIRSIKVWLKSSRQVLVERFRA